MKTKYLFILLLVVFSNCITTKKEKLESSRPIDNLNFGLGY